MQAAKRSSAATIADEIKEEIFRLKKSKFSARDFYSRRRPNGRVAAGHRLRARVALHLRRSEPRTAR